MPGKRMRFYEFVACQFLCEKDEENIDKEFLNNLSKFKDEIAIWINRSQIVNFAILSVLFSYVVGGASSLTTPFFNLSDISGLREILLLISSIIQLGVAFAMFHNFALGSFLVHIAPKVIADKQVSQAYLLSITDTRFFLDMTIEENRNSAKHIQCMTRFIYCSYAYFVVLMTALYYFAHVSIIWEIYQNPGLAEPLNKIFLVLIIVTDLLSILLFGMMRQRIPVDGAKNSQ